MDQFCEKGSVSLKETGKPIGRNHLPQFSTSSNDRMCPGKLKLKYGCGISVQQQFGSIRVHPQEFQPYVMARAKPLDTFRPFLPIATGIAMQKMHIALLEFDFLSRTQSPELAQESPHFLSDIPNPWRS